MQQLDECTLVFPLGLNNSIRCGLTRGQGNMQRTVPSCQAMAMRQQITMSFRVQRCVEYIGDILVNILATDGTKTADDNVISEPKICFSVYNTQCSGKLGTLELESCKKAVA